MEDIITGGNIAGEILKTLPVGLILLDMECNIVFLNKQQEIISRISREQVLGSVFHQTWSRLFKVRQYADTYWKLINKKEPYCYIYHDITPQFYDEKVSGIAYGAPLPSGKGFILLHDVSKEVQKDKFTLNRLASQLEESSNFLTKLTNASPNAIITVDSEDKISHINTTGESLFEYEREEILWKDLSIVFLDPAVIDQANGKEKIISGVEIQCKTQSGKVFPARMQFSQFQSMQDNRLTRLFIFTDISAEKKMEMSLNERLAFEELVSKLSARFVHVAPERVDQEISRSLSLLNDFLKIDRSSLSQFSENGNSLTVTHSYAGRKQPFLMGKNLAAELPNYTGRIQRGETIIFRDTLAEVPSTDTPLRNHCVRENLKSHLGLPLKVGDAVLGVLGFTTIDNYHHWPDELVNRLGVVANIFANALIRKNAQNAIDERLRFETLISDLSASFVDLSGPELDDQITEGLQIIAQFFGIDRGIFALIDMDSRIVVVTKVWTIAGAELPEDLTPDQFPWICEQIIAGNQIQYIHVDDLPEKAIIDRKNCIHHGVKSYLSIPMTAGGQVLGSLSFHSVLQEYHWPRELIERLRLVGEIFANAVIRRQNEENLNQAFIEIKQLKDRIEAERNYLREEIKLEHNVKNIVGKSAALQYALYKVDQVAPTDTTVLILGETGTGKELISRAIHETSTRRDRPLVKVNCATLPSHLIESELFGHEKGAFTGAHARQVGRFELADNATLFLDEIGELPLELQAKLLRVLQDGEFERIGSGKTIKVNVRIIAATNRNLESEAKHGRFRKDLWFRLNIFPITVPPLRKRNEDIPLLVNWFVSKFSKQLGKRITRVNQRDMETLLQYQWPGNIRELANFIERSVINTKGSVLLLPDKLHSDLEPEVVKEDFKTIDEMEREYITEVLEETRWKVEGVGGAAQILGLHPSTLRGRMRKHKIIKP